YECFCTHSSDISTAKRIRKWEDGNMDGKFSIIPSLSPVATFLATLDFYSRIEGFGVFPD
ncbi:MAG: hypothetical protein ACK51W_17295, partial [Aphanizomenon sp.]